jgi:hypothetical protein
MHHQIYILHVVYFLSKGTCSTFNLHSYIWRTTKEQRRMSKEQEEQLSFDHCSHSMVLISLFCIFLHVLRLVPINSYKPKFLNLICWALVRSLNAANKTLVRCWYSQQSRHQSRRLSMVWTIMFSWSLLATLSGFYVKWTHSTRSLWSVRIESR